MSYINFDKCQLVNLEYSLSRELLRANRAGSYASSTIVNCNTRKYHGMLVTPQPGIDNENHILLSSLDETVIQMESEFNLAIHKFPGGIYNPKGHKYIRDFISDPVPKLEAVHHGLGHVVDSHPLAFERVLFDPSGEGLARDMHGAHGGILDGRRSCSTRQGHPHLPWQLSPDLVELERRDEADDPFRRCGGREDEAVVLRHVVAREGKAIPAPRRAFESTFSNQAREHLCVESARFRVARANQATASDDIEDSVCACSLLHVGYCIQL